MNGISFLLFLLLTHDFVGSISEAGASSSIKNETTMTTSPLVVGGTQANKGEFPSIVMIRKVGSSNPWCGGSIINANWIVTAAHCASDEQKADFTVIAAAYASNFPDAAEQAIRQSRKVISIVRPENFNGGTLFADVAVWEVDSPFQFINTNVGAATLGTSDPMGMVTVAGWGTILPAVYLPPSFLNKVTVPTIARNYCDLLFGGPGSIHDGSFCAGSVGKDTCSGDSGGPLIQNSILYGIVSWGPSACGTKAGVYTSVATYKQWIENNAP